MAKAPNAIQASGVSICWEKITPAKTKRFLTHCRGRSEARRARIVRTPASRTGSAAAEALSDGGWSGGGRRNARPCPPPSRDALEGGPYRRCHRADLVLRQFREAWQGEDLGRRAGGMGKGAVGVGHGEHGLGGNGNRIAHGSADPGVAERGDQGVSLRRAHGELVIDVAGGGNLLGDGEGRPLQELTVARGDGAAPLVPGGEMPELHAEESGLQLVEPARVPELHVLVLPRRAVVPQPSDRLGDVVAGGEDHAAVAAAAQILRRVEGQTRYVAPRPRGTARIARPHCLRGVLDHRDAPGPRDLSNGVHGGGLAVEMHGEDGPRTRGRRALDVCGYS